MSWRLITDEDILKWLNERKRQTVAMEPCPISDVILSNHDDLNGAGLSTEGFPVASIQFLDTKGHGSVISTDPDENKRGARIILRNGHIQIWAREGEEHLYEELEHSYMGRLVHVDIYGNYADWLANIEPFIGGELRTARWLSG